MWDTCASTLIKDLNCLLLLDNDAQSSGNHQSYTCASMHMPDLQLSYSYQPEQGEAY